MSDIIFVFEKIGIIFLCVLYFNNQKRISILEDQLYKQFLNSSNLALDTKIEKLLTENDVIQAVKLVRENTSLNLVHAKQYVDYVKDKSSIVN